MTLTHTRQQSLAAERVAVRVVDSDVHPVPRQGVLADYIPEPWRSKFFATRHVGERIYYDAPDYAHCYAMRADTFPPDGEFAGSDPEMAFRQVIIEASTLRSWSPSTGLLAFPKRRRPLPSQPMIGRPITGWTAATTGTSGGAGPSPRRSSIRRRPSAKSRGGPDIPTSRRF